MSEAFASRSAGAKLELLGGADLHPDGAAVRSFEDHIRYYADPIRAEAAAFLDAGSERVSSASIRAVDGATAAEQVRALCARVRGAGASAYVVDVTSPDVRALGLVVIKVLAPELCMLDVIHGARFLGGPRLYEAAFQLGLRPEPLDPSRVNPYPHPFP
jgi:ribosomal protein S12 methylthiotransferase accessory factor